MLNEEQKNGVEPDISQESSTQKNTNKFTLSDLIDKKKFAATVQHKRIERCWTQEDLAENLSTKPSMRTVQRWEDENDVFLPRADSFLAVCDLLGIDRNALLKDPLPDQQSTASISTTAVSATQSIEIVSLDNMLLTTVPETPLVTVKSATAEDRTHEPAHRPPTLIPATRGFIIKYKKSCITVSLIVIMVLVVNVLRYIPTPSVKINSKTPLYLVLGAPVFSRQMPKIGSYGKYINAVAWSPDSFYLACALGDHTVHVFNLKTEEETMVYQGHSNYVNSVAWLPNGKQVASASTDKTIKIWDVFTGRTAMVFQATSPVWAVAVSPDGKRIAGAEEDGMTQIWSIASQKLQLTYKGLAGSGGIWGLSFSHNGKFLAAGDDTGNIQIFDTQSSSMVLKHNKPTKTIFGLDWSPDDRYIASASQDGTVQVWNTSTGETIQIHTHNMLAMHAVSWAPDGVHIASASEDGTVEVWEAFTDSPPFIYHNHSGIVFTVAWSPDGNKIASGDQNGSIQVWQA